MRRVWRLVVTGAAMAGCTGAGSSPADAPVSDGPGPADTATAVDSAPSVDAGPIDVAGQVVDRFGGPIQGVTIAIADRQTSTNADGRFAFAVVVPPYDLVAYHVGWNRAVVYDELRR